jgi:hypothetical protein
MPRAGFETTIPALQRAETFHALLRAATVNMKLLGRENSSLWAPSSGVEFVFICSVCMWVWAPIRIFFRIVGGGGSPNWVHSARQPLNGLLYLPRVIMMMENLVEWRLAGETEVLGENLPERHFVHHKSHLTSPGLEPWLARWEASD